MQLCKIVPVPKPRHNRLRGRFFTKPGEFPEVARPPERHGETRGTEGCNLREEVVSRRGEVGPAESALPA
eukprot:7396171-Pyramimonas_sp.AAC.1